MTFNLYQNRFLDTPLFYEMEAQGTYFWRQELPTNPALIKPGETLRGGRIDLYPRLSVPLKPLDIVRFEPWIGYRETIYFPDDPTGQYDKVTSREFYDVGASLATTISRVYALRGSRVQKLKHIVEPEVVYTFIPKVDQTDNPDFKYGLDRINSENAITWILTNYLIGKVVDKEGAVTYPEFLYLKLYQGYDASPDVSSEGRRHLSNFMAEARTAPFTWLSGTMNLEYNPHYRRLDVFNTGVNFADKRGDHVGVEYRLTRHQIDEISGEEINVEEINTELGIRIIDPLDFYFAYRHNLRDKVRIETVYGLDFRQQCWELTLRLHDINRSPDRLRDHEFKVMVYVTLTGLGKFRIK
jgi:LPS-assembly protein